ncbi:MAG: isoaspartyl peptidase/L-asparaginase [Spirochaetaceae bacterium]|nr:isoaspartyl peptidase/L-asparaginase [Spirochaetaceae bacterium]
MIALVCHGGCHDLMPPEDEKALSQKKLDEYGEIGFKMLETGANALDVVENVISLMEDDPMFDAGTGSFRNLNGIVEMDAMLMDSKQRCGAVQCIQNVRHPIKVARAVMEKTPHCILSGTGAVQFARSQGFPEYDPAQNNAGNDYGEAGDRKRMLCDIQYYRDVARGSDHVFSTVGVVALDDSGTLVAATSTGGIRMKMPGRVGDSAIPGAGTYCTDSVGLSATGEGEGIMKICLTHEIALTYAMKGDLAEACKAGISKGSAIDCICGVIALSRTGEISYAFNGVFMPVFHRKSDRKTRKSR